ncbi:hypothetical protein J132_00692 [Termitomyces sp. J132]|nr:hypothetical protein J132_00692 [Termitomyces sp. J132]
MSAEIASNIGLSYDPNIVLNMQSANGTMDQLLGLASTFYGPPPMTFYSDAPLMY